VEGSVTRGREAVEVDEAYVDNLRSEIRYKNALSSGMKDEGKGKINDGNYN
jgi:hypothetical protein